MKIANKFNISEESFKKMVDAGLIGCQWPTYEKVYQDYESLKNTGKSKQDIYFDLSIKYNMSPRNIKYIISRMGKI